MITRLLIANRGEIACRIIRSCRELGITAIAVYSAADEEARHVRLADEAWYLGPAPAQDSYLNIPALLDVATRARADAVHPGYGFLAENADFAQACGEANLIFVGPAPPVIDAMGNKSAARQQMAAHGIPVVPGYDGSDQTLARMRAETGPIGYPLLIKPALGGGGKGMRVVSAADELETALQAARREAQAAFGDSRLLLEKYLARPRHIEVQILGDSRGRVVSLGERDCSIQRRHQKIVEEAPAPGLSDTLRQALHQAARHAGEAVGYVGAGTVEFLVENDDFFFMEMNTRLQVEHPVTELVTGVDLVQWQLRIANGDPLPQQFPVPRGHAIEVRLYAEDPARDFLPSSGVLRRWDVASGNGLRLDSGFCSGDRVPPHYDPMLAKLIAYGRDRQQAHRRLVDALANSQIAGVANNLDFLHQLLQHPQVSRGPVDTDWLNRHPLASAEAAPALLAQAATECALWWWFLQRQHGADPWRCDGWRLLGGNRLFLALGHRDLRFERTIEQQTATRFRITTDSDGEQLEARFTPEGLLLRQDEGPWKRSALHLDGERLIWCQSTQQLVFELAPPRLFSADAEPESEQRRIKAPLHGSVSQVLCQSGDPVAAGQPLLIVEAMKMEHTLKAPRDARVQRLCCKPGDQVAEGDLLLELTNGDREPTPEKPNPEKKEAGDATLTRQTG